jgi:hypothetical protein
MLINKDYFQISAFIFQADISKCDDESVLLKLHWK